MPGIEGSQQMTAGEALKASALLGGTPEGLSQEDFNLILGLRAACLDKTVNEKVIVLAPNQMTSAEFLEAASIVGGIPKETTPTVFSAVVKILGEDIEKGIKYERDRLASTVIPQRDSRKPTHPEKERPQNFC